MPRSIFEISESAGALQNLADGSASQLPIAFDDGSGIYQSANGLIDFSIQGTRKAYINSSGINSIDCVLTGAGSPSAPSHSFSADTNTGMYNSAADTLDFTTGGVNCLSLTTVTATSTLPIMAPVGTPLIPAYAFASDNNTGMYRIGADALGFSAGGIAQLKIDTNAVIPYRSIWMQDGTVSEPTLAFVTDASTGLYKSTTSTLNLATAGVSRVALNTASLTTTLPILAPAGSVSAPSLAFSADSNTGLYNSAANTLDFACGGANIVSLTTANAKIGSGISLTKNQTVSTQTMQNISSSTSVTLTSSAQDFPYIIQPQIEVYVNNANSTAGYTGATPALLSAPLMIYTSAPSNGAGLSNALSSISFAKGIYRITYSILFNDNTPIIDFSAAHSGGAAVLQRSIDTYSGRATTSSLTADFEDIIVTTAAGTITLSWIANGKNASSTNYFVAVGSFRVYRLASY